MELELAVCLFQDGRYDDARASFLKADSKHRAGRGGHLQVVKWENADRRPRKFQGKVIASSGPSGRLMGVPENFEVRFWRDGAAASLRVGDSVAFRVQFDVRGALAIVDRKG
jgi:hypothetical protein